MNPPRSSNAHFGTLDPECPHSVNHIVVDFLGELECIIIACDDGDVLGFWTHDVRSAIDRRFIDGGPRTVVAAQHEVRPFFQLNVHLSAWGLAIHTKARKVAISANSRAVTVISFALTENPDELKIEPSEHRFGNFTVQMKGFGHNLPSIAFCNNDDDPEGRIVVTGELTGFVYVHDLKGPEQIKLMQAGFCRKAEQLTVHGNKQFVCNCHDRMMFPHSIWGLHFIDRRAFRHVPGYIPSTSASKSYSQHWNGSLMRLTVPNSSSTYALKRYRIGPRRDSHEEESDEASDEGDDDEYEESEEDLWDDNDELDHLLSTTLPPTHVPSSLQAMTHPWHANVQPSSRSIMNQPQGNGKKYHSLQHRAPFPNFDREPEKSHQVRLLSPLLFTSKNDVILQQPEQGEKPDVTPVICLEEPLKQGYDLGDATQRPPFTSSDCNRMSFHHIIPELGVLLIGSPSGRVAINALLRTDDWTGREEGTFFMRLDWILPFKSQEEDGLRPERKMVGMAVGPVQGQLGKSLLGSQRKWRLMMYYADHSVLSYELGAAC